MGAYETTNSNSEHSGNEGAKTHETEVVLNIYDLTPLNNYIYWFGFGIFHSGIEGLRSVPRILSFFFYFIYFLFMLFPSVFRCFMFFHDLGVAVIFFSVVAWRYVWILKREGGNGFEYWAFSSFILLMTIFDCDSFSSFNVSFLISSLMASKKKKEKKMAIFGLSGIINISMER